MRSDRFSELRTRSTGWSTSMPRTAAVRRALAAALSLSVAVPLGIGALVAPAQAADDLVEEASGRPAAEVVAPDLVQPTPEERAERQASTAARAAGRRVEAPELRTVTQTVYAEPDGQMVAELNSSPIRAQAEDGTWQKINTDLSAGEDGLLRPTATPVDLAFSPGGPDADAELARMEEGGAELSLASSETLPVPTLDGATATYEGVRPGVDLQVTARSWGFSTRLVVRDREAAEELIADPFQIAVSGGEGDDVRQRAGGFKVQASKGDGAISAPPPSGVDADGRPVAVDPGAERKPNT